MSMQWQAMTGNEILKIAGLYDGENTRFFDEIVKVGKLDVWQTYNGIAVFCHIAFDGTMVQRNPDGSKVRLPHSYHFMGDCQDTVSTYKGR